MQFSVVAIRSQGRRLSRAEIEAATPTVGDLVICDLLATGNSSRRVLRCAELIEWSSPQVRRSLLHPLFDPQIVRATERSMLLVGHEFAVLDGAIHEFVQGWLLRPP